MGLFRKTKRRSKRSAAQAANPSAEAEMWAQFDRTMDEFAKTMKLAQRLPRADSDDTPSKNAPEN